MLPLQMEGLRKARLIKNWQLEGVIELFSGAETGSGQIPPKDLGRVFQFTEETYGDLEMIAALGPLASFDVYSLRIELRRLGIEVDDYECLQLSIEKKRELSKYMIEFTRPLLISLFGEDHKEIFDFGDITALIMNPDKEVVLRNIESLAEALNIEVKLIPKFLENYGDVYLSLAYYQSCLDQNRPCMREVFDCIEQIRNDQNLKRDTAIIKACTMAETKLSQTMAEIENILGVFRARSADIWEKRSGKEFKKIENMVASYQSDIGGALCAITVKMKAWDQKFSMNQNNNLLRRAEFLRSQILPGIATIREIRHCD